MALLTQITKKRITIEGIPSIIKIEEDVYSCEPKPEIRAEAKRKTIIEISTMEVIASP